MAETGTDGIDTLDPPPLGDVHLADAKARVGDRLFLKGNLDPVGVVLLGTPETVRAEALALPRRGRRRAAATSSRRPARSRRTRRPRTWPCCARSSKPRE